MYRFRSSPSCPPPPPFRVQEEVSSYERIMLFACDELEAPLRDITATTCALVEELQGTSGTVDTNLDIVKISSVKMKTRLYAMRELVSCVHTTCL